MDHNEIDRILKGHGWIYDNGWRHDSVTWDCYVNSKYGSPDGYFVVLVDNGDGRVLELRKDAKTTKPTTSSTGPSEVSSLREVEIQQGKLFQSSSTLPCYSAKLNPAAAAAYLNLHMRA